MENLQSESEGIMECLIAHPDEEKGKIDENKNLNCFIRNIYIVDYYVSYLYG